MTYMPVLVPLIAIGKRKRDPQLEWFYSLHIDYQVNAYIHCADSIRTCVRYKFHAKLLILNSLVQDIRTCILIQSTNYAALKAIERTERKKKTNEISQAATMATLKY